MNRLIRGRNGVASVDFTCTTVCVAGCGREEDPQHVGPGEGDQVQDGHQHQDCLRLAQQTQNIEDDRSAADPLWGGQGYQLSKCLTSCPH